MAPGLGCCSQCNFSNEIEYLGKELGDKSKSANFLMVYVLGVAVSTSPLWQLVHMVQWMNGDAKLLGRHLVRSFVGFIF